jgi:tetratricopeptide (TPR) repeat protein
VKGGIRNILAAGVLVLAAALTTAWPICLAAEQAKAARRAEVRSDEPATQPAGRPPRLPPAAAARLHSCLDLYMKGDYSGAAAGYRKLISEGLFRVSAAVGLAEALAAEGKYADALKAVEAVGEEGVERADWQLAMAELLSVVGRYDEALGHAAEANKLRPKWAPTILARGRILETLGRKKAAATVYRSMEAVVVGGAYKKDPRSLVALGQILDRYSILAGKRASEQALNILHNYFQTAYQEVDKKYWPANVAAGMFLLSKHKPGGAAMEFDLAAKLNGRIPAVHVGRGVIELHKRRLENCLRAADAALKINPNYADALLLKANCLMQWRKFDQVTPVLEKLLAVNPNHLKALSLMAARYVRRDQPKKAEPYIERVGKVNPRCAGLPNTLGQWLAAGRQFERAEKYYKQAMALAPELAGPVTNLGLLYMQTGEEDKAREVLAKARSLDDFRRDVYNYLRILEQLEEFKVVDTEHFVIKVSEAHDAVLLDLVADYVEGIYPEVCTAFDHEPPGKTLIEIFPTHPGFSVRISGRAWVGTVGASTGPVVAMVAPNRERSEFGTYNWATVLRHEFTHTVTLSASDNRIPHWFTEACAVRQQPDRRNYDAVKVLVDATREGRLFPVSQLNWGFIRPKRLADRTLAYAQSEWTMEHIIVTKGYETILKMMRGYRDGMTQQQVFKKILGTTESQFDKAFRAWAKKQVESWGFRAAAPPGLAKAEAAAKARPDDPAAQAELAVAYYYRRRIKQAEKAARRALQLDPKNTRALAVLSEVLLMSKSYEEAISYAKKLEELDSSSKTAPRVLAKSYLATHRWADAISQLELLKHRRPLAPYSYDELAKLYMQLGQPSRAMPNLIELHRRTMKDSTYARQIAEVYRTQMDQPQRALEYYRQITHINPYEASAYKAIAEICILLDRCEQAVEAAENFTLLQAQSAEAWSYLAMARYHLGRLRKDEGILREAKAAAEKALKIAPGDSKVERILRRIQRALGEEK